jgi:hypothetical protein
MKFRYTLFLLFLSSIVLGQDTINRFPVWTFQRSNVNVYGVALGATTMGNIEKFENTRVNGIKFDALGLGWVVLIAPGSFISASDSAYKEGIPKVRNRINGINFSVFGSLDADRTNGFRIGLLAQRNLTTNGISIAPLINSSERINGIQLGGVYNESYRLNGIQIGLQNKVIHGRGIQINGIAGTSETFYGIQIGLFNISEKLRGFQLGLWNVNQKRKWPIVNWCFRG